MCARTQPDISFKISFKISFEDATHKQAKTGENTVESVWDQNKKRKPTDTEGYPLKMCFNAFKEVFEHLISSVLYSREENTCGQ